MIRRLVDPSITETINVPKDLTELVQQLSHHWMPLYDNITHLPDWVSDALCRAVTGEGASKRVLYTDDDDQIYSYRRCIGLNGINIAAHKPDLLDRSLLFSLEPILPADRKPEKRLWKEFEDARPGMVGALLDALSKAVVLRPGIRLPALPRMADFTEWGCAISLALGFQQDEFLQALDENLGTRNEEVLLSNPVASMVMTLMSSRSRWEGPALDLLSELEKLAGEHRVDIKGKGWPKAAHILTRRLKEVDPNLLVGGVRVTTGERGATGRSVTLEKIHVALTSCNAGDSHDATAGGPEVASQEASTIFPRSSNKIDASDASDATSVPPTLRPDNTNTARVSKLPIDPNASDVVVAESSVSSVTSDKPRVVQSFSDDATLDATDLTTEVASSTPPQNPRKAVEI